MFLGIDLGTGSCKALLLNHDGAIVAEASQAYPVKAPRPGWAESDPLDWWQAVGKAVRAAVGKQAPAVRAIGLSGQMHGVVLADAEGNPLYPAILWADGRSGAELTALHQLSEAQQQRLANPLVVGMAAPSLLWLKQHRPALYQAARWALQPKDWLRLRLTGEVGSEPSDASGTLLYDLLADRWAWDILEALELRPGLLPPLGPSAQVAGTLKPEAARHLGLPAGIPVAAGAADTAAALLGSGLPVGEAQLTVGTGAQITVLLTKPKIDPTLRTHLYRAALPGQWYAMAAMQNAGLALEWVRAVLGLSWAQAYREAEAVSPGSEGLTFLPYLTGERTPHLDPLARGVWAGLGRHHRRGHLMRAALEGVAFGLRAGLEALGEAIPPHSPLRLAGGGTAHPFWRQLLADVLKRPLQGVPVRSASALGAALLGALSQGLNPQGPQPPAEPAIWPQASYEEGYTRFKQLYAGLAGWFGAK
ncbi:MAG: xylulokinase [Meiothermus sp.]|uniref:xylulokinase n=1 Tax=Meiothermus sp. TaxID=1955249 RepID=UPI0025EEDDAC|nr:xylulokinase [Meiothermus sp.]MCS7069454.1 xylulokinase [Meiothermus sp.]MDW8425835.1 xylulokinase [Meiothermus sp.]